MGVLFALVCRKEKEKEKEKEDEKKMLKRRPKRM